MPSCRGGSRWRSPRPGPRNVDIVDIVDNVDDVNIIDNVDTLDIYLVMAEHEAVPAGEAEGQQRGQRGHEAEPAHPHQPQHLPANQRRGLWSRDQLSTNHSSPPTQTSLSVYNFTIVYSPHSPSLFRLFQESEYCEHLDVDHTLLRPVRL